MSLRSRNTKSLVSLFCLKRSPLVCSFVSCYFIPAFSRPAISCPAFSVRHFHVLHIGPSISCPAISCPANRSVNFTSVIFTSSIFSAPASLIGYWHRPVIRLSVCDAVSCGSQGWCTGLKVVPACS